MERTSDLHLLSHFIIRRMLYGHHQIFCNFISSDLELNINVGKLDEKTKKEENAEGKRTVTLCILNCRLISFAGREKTGFVLSSLESVSVCSHTPACMVCPEMYIWESRDLSQRKGVLQESPAWLLCVVRLPPSATLRGVGWPGMAAGLLRVLLCLTSVLAPPGL